MDQEIRKKLLRASMKAANDYLWYSPAFISSRYVEDERVGTLGMDSQLKVHYSVDFIKERGLDKNEADLEAILLHEIMHYMSNHHVRYLNNKYRTKLGFDAHNVAMDIEINQHINNDHINKFGMTAEKFGYPKGKSYEAYIGLLYSDIQKSMKKQSQGGEQGKNNSGNGHGSGLGNGKGNNKEIDPTNLSGQDIIDALARGEMLRMSKIDMNGVNEGNQNEVQSQVDGLNSRCMQRNSGVGDKHVGNELISKVPKKVYSWDKVFRGLIGSVNSKKQLGYDYGTYRKINRRMSAVSNSIIYPSRYEEKQVLNLIIGVDISGSMGNLTEAMYARIKSIMDKIDNDSIVRILECDTEVSKVIENFDYTAATLKVGSGGGTDMDAIIRYTKEHVDKKEWKEPDAIVIMTDNYVDWDTDSTLYKSKVKVLTDNISDSCPYKQFEVILDQTELDAQYA